MPIYEYVCNECHFQFEAIRSMKDADQQIPCKKCDSKDTRRMISVFYAQSSGQSITHSGGGCGSCSGGTCSSCNN